MSEWISVKDRMPDKVGKYLIFRHNIKPCIRIQDFMAYDIYSKNKKFHELNFYEPSGLLDKYVTHWMPLPELPNDFVEQQSFIPPNAADLIFGKPK